MPGGQDGFALTVPVQALAAFGGLCGRPIDKPGVDLVLTGGWESF
jgi:hypothetical protein